MIWPIEWQNSMFCFNEDVFSCFFKYAFGDVLNPHEAGLWLYNVIY